MPGRTSPASLATRWLGLARVAGESLQESRGRADAAATGPTAEVDTGPLDGAAEAVATPREWFEAERGSLVSAVVTTSREGDPDLAGALALAVRDFLAMRAYDDDRERVLRVALEAHAERPDVMSAPRQRLSLLTTLRGPGPAPTVRPGSLTSRRRRSRSPGRLDDPQAQQRTLSMSGWAAMMADHFGEAMTSFDAAAALASRLGDEAGRLRAEAQRGVVLRNVGRAAEADPLLAARVEQSRTMEPRRSTSIWLTTRAEGLLDLQRWDEAQSLLAEALDLAQAIQDDLGTAHCRLALARVHCGLGDLDRAEAEARGCPRRARPAGPIRGGPRRPASARRPARGPGRVAAGRPAGPQTRRAAASPRPTVGGSQRTWPGAWPSHNGARCTPTRSGPSASACSRTSA